MFRLTGESFLFGGTTLPATYGASPILFGMEPAQVSGDGGCATVNLEIYEWTA